MNKIKLTENQFKNLVELGAALSVSEPEYIQENTGENIRAAIRLCKELTLELNDLQNTLDDTMYALSEKKIDESIAKMTEYTQIAKAVKEDAATIENYLAGSISKFIEISKAEETFIVTATSEEIQKVIDTNFEICPVMSVGYKDGVYALLFGEDDDTIDIEPFIFAEGNEDDYDKAQRFIETFLDLEEMYE